MLYNGYNKVKDKDFGRFVVIKGIEYDTSDAGHMIIVLPSNTDVDIFTHKGMKVKDTMKIVKALGGIIGPAHPFDYYKLGMLNNAKWIKNEEIIKEFDFIEGFNSCGSIIGNKKSEMLSRIYNKPMFGGSDSHRKESAGKAHTILPKRINSEDELIELIREVNFRDIKIKGEYFEGTMERKHKIMHKIGIRAFYGASFLTNKHSKKKAIRKAEALSLI